MRAHRVFMFAALLTLALVCVAAALPRVSPGLTLRLIDAWRLPEQLEALPTGPSQAPPDAPDVVIIVLDTVRRDALGLYTPGEPSDTPNIDRWSRDARVFERARSVSSWTLPAHASLFTGLPPARHGARGGAPDDVDAFGLPAELPTLAEAFAQAGWATAGVASNQAYLQSGFGLSRGFDLWLCEQLPDSHPDLPYVSGERITRLARGVLEQPRERPIFLFLNYMDAHAPYKARPGYLPQGAELLPETQPWTQQWSAAANDLMGAGVPLPPGVADSWRAAYRAELRYLDEHLGRLLDDLPALGIGDEDLVVILSDHGEYMGEHQLVEHSKDLYEEAVAIPLIARGPGHGAGRDASPVQTQDVTRWALQAAALEPLAGARSTPDMQVSELYWSRHKELEIPGVGERLGRIRRAFVKDENKLLIGSDGSLEAYALGDDPLERRPLADAPWAAELQEQARRWLELNPPREGQRPDAEQQPELLQALQALGYVEGD